MKTASNILREWQTRHAIENNDDPLSDEDWEELQKDSTIMSFINAMKEYRSDGQDQVLKDAAENAMMKYVGGDHLSVIYEVDKQSILNTIKKLP